MILLYPVEQPAKYTAPSSILIPGPCRPRGDRFAGASIGNRVGQMVKAYCDSEGTGWGCGNGPQIAQEGERDGDKEEWDDEEKGQPLHGHTGVGRAAITSAILVGAGLVPAWMSANHWYSAAQVWSRMSTQYCPSVLNFATVLVA